MKSSAGIERFVSGFALAASCLTAACSNQSADAKSADQQLATAHVEEIGDTSVVAVPHPELFQVVAVQLRDIPDRLNGTCVVTPDVNRTVPVNALGGGRVSELRATLGDHVDKGQTLVVITSPDLSTAISSYQKAVADELLSRRQLDRSRLLFEHGSIARKDLEAAEDGEDKAQIDLRTTAEQIRILGGSVEHPTPFIELKAPISGTIVQQGVTQSAGVKSPDNAPNLFTIADLSRVWVLCDVYENDLSRVRVGELAHVHLNAYPARTFRARVGNIAPLLDSTTRTAKVRVELENPSGIMRLGMFATADLISPTSEPRLVVPAGALLRLHDQDWAFVKVGANKYRRIPVQVGPSAADGIQQVLAGLARGDSVARDALQFSQASARE